MITGFGTSLQTRCLLQPDVLPKSQATHTLNGFLEVRGMAHTQTRGFPTLIYQPLGLTSLPPDLLSSDSSPAMATKSRDWSSSASLFDGYECEIIGSTRPKAFFHLASCYCEQQSKGCFQKPSRFFLGPSFCPIERMIPGHRLWS